jgi:hypothetical protein
MGMEWSEPLLPPGEVARAACWANRERGDPEEGEPTSRWGLLFKGLVLSGTGAK